MSELAEIRERILSTTTELLADKLSLICQDLRAAIRTHNADAAMLAVLKILHASEELALHTSTRVKLAREIP